MGKICRMLYAEDEISEDQFDAVRIFVSHHHAACKKAVSTGGGGDWCDY
jgi:hypothetical protein